MELDDRQTAILASIVRAYRTPLESGAPAKLYHYIEAGSDGQVDHHAWPADGPSVAREDLESLSEIGAIRLDYHRHSISFAPTAESMSAVAEYERQVARAERGAVAVDLEWELMHSVLRAAVDAWEGGPASVGGYVRVEDFSARTGLSDLELEVALEYLAQDGWLRLRFTDGVPTSAQPTERALKGTRGWPGGDPEVAVARLLAALAEIQQRDDDPKKREGAGRARDFLISLGSGTLSEVIVKAGGGVV